jgi:PAS domain S-box-containing protein
MDDPNNTAINGSMTIMIAEDSPTQAAKLIHLLEKRGFPVIAARDGRHALDLLESMTPSLVITDVVMPEVDGYGLCSAIKADPRWKHIPVMLVTTLSNAEDVIRGLECGADNFIRKPYEEKYLLSRVEYMLMNLRMRKSQKMQAGVEITLGSQRHFITSERQQILDLLISTYEQAVQLNLDLKRHERELEHANRLLGGLYRIAEGLNQAESEEQIAELVLERALELPGIQSGWLLLREDSGFRLAAARNLPPALRVAGAFEGECLCSRKCLPGVTNIVECERLQGAAGETRGPRFHATVPLSLGERMLGTLNLVGPEDGQFEVEELKILDSIGNQVAVALDRTRLVAEEKRRATARIAEQAALIDEAHDALLESEERYRLMFDRNPHPTWVYDIETLGFLAVNEAALRHYGYTREEFLRMTIADIRPPEEVAQLMHALEEDPESSEPRVFGVFRHRKKDGALIEVEISSSEITFEGRRAGLVLAMDVTDRRRFEKQFLRAQRMESIGTLAAGIAHDLNNLLMPIMMGVTLLKQYNPSQLGLRALDNIERSAIRGRDLVKQVLSFARGVEGSRVPINVGDVIREVRSIVESTFPKNVSLEMDSPDDLWWIDGDPTQLNQVLLNLCVNARDAMPIGGVLAVTARNADIDEHYASMHRGLTAGRFVMVQVADAGVGIPQQIIDRIFEPFFTTKEVGRGTGLGLSTVVAIVRSHGGTVHVYSELGKGTKFTVYLPAQQLGETPALPSQPAKRSLPRGDGELILVVDDEPPILAITLQTLEAFGYKVIVSKDGAQAVGLYALRRDEIALVITDMMMPVMDGPALITALRHIDPDVKIIASSGLTDDGRASRAAFAGITDFLYKPYSADVLLNTVSGLLKRR